MKFGLLYLSIKMKMLFLIVFDQFLSYFPKEETATHNDFDC